MMWSSDFRAYFSFYYCILPDICVIFWLRKKCMKEGCLRSWRKQMFTQFQFLRKLLRPQLLYKNLIWMEVCFRHFRNARAPFLHTFLSRLEDDPNVGQNTIKRIICSKIWVPHYFWCVVVFKYNEQNYLTETRKSRIINLVSRFLRSERFPEHSLRGEKSREKEKHIKSGTSIWFLFFLSSL